MTVHSNGDPQAINSGGSGRRLPRSGWLAIVLLCSLVAWSFTGPWAPIGSDDIPSALANGETIDTADQLHITVDGRTFSVDYEEGTVADALARANIRLNPNDRVVPGAHTFLRPGMDIVVTRVVQKQIEEIEMIPFAVTRWVDPSLEPGEERLVQQGEEGMLQHTFVVTYENGEEVHRTLVETEVISRSIDQIHSVGTDEVFSVLQTDTEELYYVDVLEMVATAYTPGPESTGEWSDGYTFSGLRAGKGVVAVDPEIIPLGTWLYVPGYGKAIAADIGGAIKGYRIDLGFESLDEALQYGRQTVNVYVLAE